MDPDQAMKNAIRRSYSDVQSVLLYNPDPLVDHLYSCSLVNGSLMEKFNSENLYTERVKMVIDTVIPTNPVKMIQAVVMSREAFWPTSIKQDLFKAIMKGYRKCEMEIPAWMKSREKDMEEKKPKVQKAANPLWSPSPPRSRSYPTPSSSSSRPSLLEGQAVPIARELVSRKRLWFVNHLSPVIKEYMEELAKNFPFWWPTSEPYQRVLSPVNTTNQDKVREYLSHASRRPLNELVSGMETLPSLCYPLPPGVLDFVESLALLRDLINTNQEELVKETLDNIVSGRPSTSTSPPCHPGQEEQQRQQHAHPQTRPQQVTSPPVATSTTTTAPSSPPPPVPTSHLSRERESECVVCLSDTKEWLFLPCRHLCCCTGCAQVLSREVVFLCPICRKTVEQQMRVFS